ncbi:hypothetical protein [Methylobacterium sp. J-068]|uniref:COG3904 family protein n=1 Tax=Methylobacterium sp. J-068 TaxID=2836649 RepID=UPI001FB8A49E|nr:hypothetical protein [Methylobacterium sp. J-068]MCJ2036186.1 hypothetical protein [Methylobacterium sp. J-068]
MATDAGRTAGLGWGRLPRMLCALVLVGTACGALAGTTRGALMVSGMPSALGAAYAALSLRLEDRLQTRVAGPPARIALGPHGRDVRLAGEIGEGSAERLATLLAAHHDVTRIHLTSEGGLVEEATAIGDLIAARGLATYVPDYCVSACTLAFVRGSARYLVTNGRLGFHAPYDPGLFGQIVQADGAAERAAYVAAGVDPDFATQALGVASDSLWIPEAARLVQARVVTEIVDTDRFPDSTLDDDPSPVGARAAILRALPLLEGLAPPDGSAWRADRVSAMAAAYLDGYRAGRPEGEALDRLRARAQGEIARTLRGADDATWVEIGRTLLRAMRRAEPQACLTIGGEGNLLVASETLSDDEAARGLLARAAGQEAGRGDAAAPAAAPRLASARGPRDCGGLIAAYAHALARPGAGPAVRALAGQGMRPAQEAAALPR